MQVARSLANPRRAALQARIQQDPYYRLQSLTEVAIAAELGVQLDVNRASVDDWLRLPGLSIRQARSLVELTSSGVQLLCLADMAAVLGVSGDRLRPLAPLLCFTYYDADSDTQPPRLNPNRASAT
ncbi:MAG: helix-hairpin-helix domain-containing protein, partial [Spirulinaceae cyanobacterium RM2_2_10]|nr:helix-hairpin-helix domain-containing protein [Spirulinaceae cyanobacterium RM2_2_10]